MKKTNSFPIYSGTFRHGKVNSLTVRECGQNMLSRDKRPRLRTGDLLLTTWKSPGTMGFLASTLFSRKTD